MRVVKYISNTASVLSEAETVSPSGAPVFIPGFDGVRAATYISITAGVLLEAGTVYPSGAPLFIPGFWWGPSCFINK